MVLLFFSFLLAVCCSIGRVAGVDVSPDTPSVPWTDNPITISWTLQGRPSPIDATNTVDIWLTQCPDVPCLSPRAVQLLGQGIDVQLRRYSFVLGSAFDGDKYVIKLATPDTGDYFRYSGQFSIHILSPAANQVYRPPLAPATTTSGTAASATLATTDASPVQSTATASIPRPTWVADIGDGDTSTAAATAPPFLALATVLVLALSF